MGHTTRISDYEWDRGDGAKEVPEGYDLEAKSKVIEAEKKPAPKKSTVKTTTKDVKS